MKKIRLSESELKKIIKNQIAEQIVPMVRSVNGTGPKLKAGPPETLKLYGPKGEAPIFSKPRGKAIDNKYISKFIGSDPNMYYDEAEREVMGYFTIKGINEMGTKGDFFELVITDNRDGKTKVAQFTCKVPTAPTPGGMIEGDDAFYIKTDNVIKIGRKELKYVNFYNRKLMADLRGALCGVSRGGTNVRKSKAGYTSLDNEPESMPIAEGKNKITKNMKKTIRLTESQLVNVIKRITKSVLKEQAQQPQQGGGTQPAGSTQGSGIPGKVDVTNQEVIALYDAAKKMRNYIANVRHNGSPNFSRYPSVQSWCSTKKSGDRGACRPMGTKDSWLIPSDVIEATIDGQYRQLFVGLFNDLMNMDPQWQNQNLKKRVEAVSQAYPIITGKTPGEKMVNLYSMARNPQATTSGQVIKA